MSRWGGFRKGRTRYTNNWDELKAPGAIREETVAETPQQFSYVEAKGIWNLNSTMQFPKSNALGAISMSFVASAIGESSVTIPASAQAGDLAIIFSSATGLSIAKEFPVDFTEIREDHDVDDHRMVSGYKILNSADIGSTKTGMNDSLEGMGVLVFRPNRSITTVTVSGVNGQATIATPSDQVLTMASVSAPVIGVAFRAATATVDLANQTQPDVMTHVFVPGPGGGYDAYMSYVVYNPGSNPVDVTVSMLDEGDNAMQSWVVTVS